MRPRTVDTRHSRCTVAQRSAVKIAPSQRYRRRAPLAPGRDDLVDARAAFLERARAGSHVEPPDAVGRFIDLLQSVLAARLESFHPVAQRQRVMRSQSFDVVNFEPGALHAELDVADAIELAIGKDVTVDEPGGRRLFPPFLIVRDAVVEE